MAASGTRARIACTAPRGSSPSTRPRRELRSPMTSPRYSSGVTTSTAMTGSSSFGWARPIAFFNPTQPPTLNPIRLHRLLDAEVDRGYVLARDLAADDLVEELVALARLGRLEVDDGVAVLAAA